MLALGRRLGSDLNPHYVGAHVTCRLDVVVAANKNGHESSRSKDIRSNDTVENENDDQHLLMTPHDESEIRDYLKGSALKRSIDSETVI